MKRLITGVAVLVFALPAVAQEDYQWPTAMWPSVGSCPLEKTIDVDLKDVLKAPRSHDGQCVRIKGYYPGRALFLDPDDTVIKYASSVKETKGRRIGVSGSDEILHQLNRRHDQRYVELTGIIWQCEDNGPWMGGYCHYVDGGPFIGIISAKRAREQMRFQNDD